MFRKIVLTLLCLTVVLAGCTKKEETMPIAFLRINQTLIAQEELFIYLEEAKNSFEEIGGLDIWETDFDGRKALDVALESAYNSMVAVKVSSQKAKDIGLVLSEETQKAIEENAETQLRAYEEKGIEITDNLKAAVKVVMEEKEYYSLVQEELVKGYVISEVEYKAYEESYYEETALQMREITIQSIICASQDLANEAYDKAVAGVDYNTLFDDYNVDAQNEGSKGHMLMHQKDLEGDLAQFAQSQEGFIGRPVEEDGDRWAIFKVVEVNESEKEVIIEKLRSDYTTAMWQQIYNKELEKWISQAQIERNSQAWEQFVKDNKK